MHRYHRCLPPYQLLTAIALLSCYTLLACSKVEEPTEVSAYDSVPVKRIVSPLLYESSGIADSKKNPATLWVQEDSGNPPQLHLLGHDGLVKKSIYVKGATNRDWEDIALAAGKIYVGDIGDNGKIYQEYQFYVFDEPSIVADTVFNPSVIRFTYPDGSHDAEAFIVDSISGDIYIITKGDNPAGIYKLPHPHSTTAVNIARLVGHLTYSGVVSASISPDAKSIIVKTYNALFLYKRGTGENLETALQRKAITLPYTMEPQGEAVCFAIDNSGFFTLSEKGFASAVYLFFYRRK